MQGSSGNEFGEKNTLLFKVSKWKEIYFQ
jgi:hypothetical protein